MDCRPFLESALLGVSANYTQATLALLKKNSKKANAQNCNNMCRRLSILGFDFLLVFLLFFSLILFCDWFHIVNMFFEGEDFFERGAEPNYTYASEEDNW